MLNLFQRIVRSVLFRAAATALVLSLVLAFVNFLLTVYQANKFLLASEITQLKPVVTELENAFFYGIVSLGLLSLILVAAIFDLTAFMRTTKQFRALSNAIVQLANGNLTPRLPVHAGGPIEEIQRSFNEMADSIVVNIDKLEENNRFQKELVANVAHDLGSPLTAVLGYLDTINMKAEALSVDTLKRYVLIAKSNAQYISKLVSDLNTLSRFDASEMPVFPEIIQLEPFIERIKIRFEDRLNQKNMRIRTSIPETAQRLAADKILFERALVNIVENAIKFGSKDSTIEISSRNEGDLIALDVHNEGDFIPEQDLPHVFDRFFRVGQDRSRETGGSGLGLAIVGGIMKLHEATIEVQNHEKGGVIVRLFFPTL